MSSASVHPRLDETLLRHVPPFAKLSGEEIRTLLDLSNSRHLPAEQSVFEEGARADHFFILLDGHVRVVRYTVGGDKVILLHIPTGELFGIAPALGHEFYPATAITATDCVVLSWPRRLFQQFIAEYAGFANQISHTVGHRFDEMSTKLVELSTQRVEQRVANALTRLAGQSGSEVADGIKIDFPITRKDLSELTATTLHTASRLLSQWQKDGIVKSHSRHIVVCDTVRLQGLAQQHV